MEFKEFFSEFVQYSKARIIKIVVASLLVLYFTFLITYNVYRVNQTLEASWTNGILSAVLVTIILIIGFDFIGFFLKKRKD